MTTEGGFELARAITQNELELHYQPIFARALGCVGAQGYGLAKLMASRVLVRWAQDRA